MTDGELVKLALENDELAKEQLLNRCADVISYNVQKYKSMFWGRLNSSDVEDLKSECYLAILENIKLYDETRGSGFPNWAKFIVRNRILNLLRLKINTSKLINTGMDISRVPAPQSRVTDLQVSSLISDRDKQIIAMMLDGESQTDIAKALGVGKAAITMALKRVMR